MRSTQTDLKAARRSPTGRVEPSPAFTLVELLMVVMVIGIVTAITLPTFVRSIRGNRLRMAARTVIMAGRYARNMAILNQREMLLELDTEASRVSVRPVRSVRLPGMDEAPSAVSDLGGILPWVKEEDKEEMEDESDASPSARAGKTDIVRVLDQVKISRVEILDAMDEDADEIPEGARQVLYGSNGRCTPYRVTLLDDEGQSVAVKVDRLGSVETERL